MSFSSEIKEELSGQIPTARHCQLAEIAAILSFCSRVNEEENGLSGLRMHTENLAVARKYFTLLKKTFNIRLDVSARQNKSLKGGHSFEVVSYGDISAAKHVLSQNLCCKRAYIRGAFLASGSVSDPEKGYHFEIVCTSLPQAKQIQSAMNSFEADAKIVTRKKNQVVYVKEGTHIVDLLNVMGAHEALMNLENVRIVKEMRNSVNRQVNCETANISKTVNAAVRQIEDIVYIRDHMGLESLPDHLREMALLRLKYPDVPLKELGSYLNPPVGKSGVNHRLRKLSKIAEEMR